MDIFNETFDYLMNTNENNVQNIINNIFSKICVSFNIYCGIITRIDNSSDITECCSLHINKISFYNKENNNLNSIFDDNNIELMLNKIKFNEIITEFNENNDIEKILKNCDDKMQIVYLKIKINNDDGILIFINKLDSTDDHSIDLFEKIVYFINNIFMFITKISNLDERKMNFISNMSHEVRTPLNAIMTMTEIIIKKNNNIDENNKKYFHIIKTSGLELMNILNNMLDYSKVLTNKMKLKFEPISLLKCIKIVFLMLEPETIEKKLKISFKFDENIPNMIISDVVRLKQILVNILSNSIKFTKNGYVKLFVECINKNDKYCEILFKIIDTGIGIDENKIDNVFDYFRKTENTYLSDDYGVGVGLSIAKHIVSLFKGKIWIENNNIEQQDIKHKGTIVNINLKFNIFNEDIDINIIKDHFYHNKVLILNNDKNERLELIKLFSTLNMKPILTMSLDEITEYLTSDDTYELILINYSDLDETDIANFHKIKDDISKILITDLINNSPEEQILYDYKLTKPIILDDMINILNIIYTINKFEAHGIENEIIHGNKKHKLNTFNHDKINNSEITILIVDDNKQNQECMEQILKFKKFNNIDCAEDGEEALEKMISKNYNFVLMDIKIPIFNGITVVKKYKDQCPQSKTFIAAITAGISDEIKQQCFDVKMDAFLSKPINIDSFDKIINLMLKKI
jgi:signal transduction histidine kinase/CheY-like chemotaxis protein